MRSEAIDIIARAPARVLPVLIPVRLSSREHGQNARHRHWSGRAAVTRDLREDAALATVSQWPIERREGVAAWGALVLDLTYYRAKGQPAFDVDAIVSNAKAAIDGLFDALPGANDRQITTIVATQGQDPGGTGALLLRLRAAVDGEMTEVEA